MLVALMDTRGLVKLIALNFGDDLGILPPCIFSILGLMTLITTAITAPLLGLARWIRRRRGDFTAVTAAPAH